MNIATDRNLKKLFVLYPYLSSKVIHKKYSFLPIHLLRYKSQSPHHLSFYSIYFTFVQIFRKYFKRYNQI